jgi:hypothetical protein
MSNTHYIYGDLYAAQSGGTIFSAGTALELIFGAGGNETLAQTLANGNETGSNNIIMSAGTYIQGSGGTATLSLGLFGNPDSWFLGNATFPAGPFGPYITADSNQMNLTMDSTLDFGLEVKPTSATIGGYDSGAPDSYNVSSPGAKRVIHESSLFTPEDVLVGSIVEVLNGTEKRNANMPVATALFLNAGDSANVDISTFYSGVTNSVIAGGVGITADTSNTLYAQNLSLKEDFSGGTGGGVIYSGGTDLYNIFGAGGGETLAQTLALGNTTGTNSIIVSDDQVISTANVITADRYEMHFDTANGGTDRVMIRRNSFGDGGQVTVGEGIMSIRHKLGTRSHEIEVGVDNQFIFTDSGASAPTLNLKHNNFDGLLLPGNLTGTQTWTLPDASGTVALTSDIIGYSGNTLAEVLANENTTGANNIIVSGGQSIQLSTAANTITSIFGSTILEVTGISKSIQSITNLAQHLVLDTQFTYALKDGTKSFIYDTVIDSILIKTSAGIAGTLDWSTITASRVHTLPDASGTVALTSDIIGYSGNTLAEVLANENTTGANDIILTDGQDITSSVGGGQLTLNDSFGPDGTWSITSDNRAYGSGSTWVYGQVGNGSQLSYQKDASEAIGFGVYSSDVGAPLLSTAKEVVIIDNVSGSKSSGNIDKRAVFVGTRNSTINAGVTNSVVVGGVGVTASQDDTLYTQNFNATAITGDTIHANTFFSMAPYTGANPSSPSDNDLWMHSGATGTITLNYRIGGNNFSVELAP